LDIQKIKINILQNNGLPGDLEEIHISPGLEIETAMVEGPFPG